VTEHHPAGAEFTNRLAHETSPYLLQHAHNPVDWYPWGPEALARAEQLDRPIFLSVGYAACHWCHVMAHESFEDGDTAQQLNAGFVSIKVDREERPDVDAIYMDAVQQMTGQGGWPMTVFLTPDGRPFYGGTYFPNRRGLGLPAFRDLLSGVTEAWQTRRNEIEESADRLASAVARGQSAPAWHPLVDAEGGEDTDRAALRSALDGATAAAIGAFDHLNGGWGRAPKFPQAAAIEFLLREHVRTGAEEPLGVATRSLDTMAAGGIHDQLGGGFARYATDAAWLVPHFEKMLYDNAQLARVYTHAWLLTGEARYADVARDTLEFMARELRTPKGAFASSLDADTGGHEGATYVWQRAEIDALLGADGALFGSAYGVTAGGNWEGTTILSRVAGDSELAERFGRTPAEVADTLARDRAVLHERRRARPQPNRDDKVIAAWNGLAVAAFADASWALHEPRYREIAEEAASAVWELLVDENGRLHRSWNRGTVRGAGTLEDHSHLAEGYLALYQATFDEHWFDRAVVLMSLVEVHFVDPEGNGFLDTSDDGEPLLARPRGLQDNAVPSGNAMAATVFLALAALTGEQRYGELARGAVLPLARVASQYPTSFAHVLQAIGTIERGIDEIAIVGDPAGAGTRALVAAYRATLRPWSVAALSDDPDRSNVPLLGGRTRVHGDAAAYVCRGFACRLPVTTASDFERELAAAAG
jgi:uncharacterized protein YyaL (SSP411 family)